MDKYIALVRKEPATSYGVDFPDFPGCVSGGETFDDAAEGARGALALHIEGLIAAGDPVPEPSTFEAVLADPDNRDALAIEIAPHPVKTRSVRYTATMDEGLLARVDGAAAAAGDSRSGFIAEACRARLEGDSNVLRKGGAKLAGRAKKRGARRKIHGPAARSKTRA